MKFEFTVLPASQAEQDEINERVFRRLHLDDPNHEFECEKTGIQMYDRAS